MCCCRVGQSVLIWPTVPLGLSVTEKGKGRVLDVQEVYTSSDAGIIHGKIVPTLNVYTTLLFTTADLTSGDEIQERPKRKL